MATATERIEQHLAQRKSDERRVIGYLQRLNLAGMDHRGQMSSAYSQAGLGASTSVKVDFGALLVPLVHLTLGAGAGAARSAHGITVLHRLQDRAWLRRIGPGKPPVGNASAPVPPLARPDWSSSQPLALARLGGRTLEFKSQIAAAAWAGLGEDFGSDEAGISGGLKIEGHARGSLTGLADDKVVHFRGSGFSGALSDHVDDIFEQNVKRRAAAWLLLVGNGWKEARELGLPRRAFETTLRRVKDDGEWIEDATVSIARLLDESIIPDIESEATIKVGGVALRGLFAVARKVKTALGGPGLKTEELLADLQAVRTVCTDWIDVLEGRARPEEFPGPEAARDMRPIVFRRLGEVDDLIGALKRARDAKRGATAPVPPTAGQSAKSPLCHLDLTSVQAWGKRSAGVKLVMPFSVVKVKANALKRIGSKRVGFRYQNFAPDATGAERTLIATQDTIINYNLALFETEGVAQRRGRADPSGSTAAGRSGGRRIEPWNTMVYRTAQVQWFDDLREANHSALPNGSGLCFGLSVLAGRFRAYRAAARAVPKPASGGRPRKLDDGDLHAFEQVLKKQLRVNTIELRAFMRRVPDLIGDDLTKRAPKDEALERELKKRGEALDDYVIDATRSVILESTFALKVPVRIQVNGNRPEGLFELDPFKAVIEGERRDGDEIDLQSIRLRLRLGADEDRSRSLISLGWNPEPWGEEKDGFRPPFIDPAEEKAENEKKHWLIRLTGIDPKLPDFLKTSALAIGVGLSLDRIERVGSEGMVDLYVRFYPNPYGTHDYGPHRARDLEESAAHDLAEISVPPTLLFSQ